MTVGTDSTTARAIAYLAEHPDTSANAVWRAVGGRRQDVLRAVKAVRAAASRFPAAGNRRNEGT